MSETEIVLVRNDTYWGGRPNLDRVVFKVIPSAQARLAAMKAGEVDVIGGDYLAPLAPEETTSLRGDSNIEVLRAPSATNLLLAFNSTTGNPALADPEVDGAVLDVRMPPTFTDEGLRAAIAVRERRPGFPVLVLSQYVDA